MLRMCILNKFDAKEQELCVETKYAKHAGVGVGVGNSAQETQQTFAAKQMVAKHAFEPAQFSPSLSFVSAQQSTRSTPVPHDGSLKVEACTEDDDLQSELGNASGRQASAGQANFQKKYEEANKNWTSLAAIPPGVQDGLIHPQRSTLKPLPEGYRIVQTMTKDGRYEDTVTYDIHQSHQMKLSVVKEVNLMSWLEQKLHRFNVPDDAIQSVGKAIVGSTAARVVQSITKPIDIGDAVVDRYCIVALRDKSNPRDRSNFQMRIDHFTDHLGVQCPAPQEWSLKVETCDEMGALPSRTR